MHSLALVQDICVVLLVAGAAGWICQKLGISVVVGYLLAGIVIGPYTPPFTLVSSIESVHGLANLGLIFVLFFIGLELSLPRLKVLGVPAFATAGATAVLVLALSGVAAKVLGLSLTQSLFLGGVLIVSSSAIIDKVLHELDASHESFARLALGITVLEDLLAVVMLAILGSLAGAESGTLQGLGLIIGKMLAFVAVVVVVGLLVLPRMLGLLRRTASRDVQTLCLAALLLGGAWIAAEAGYSVALGAFLVGSVFGSTRHRAFLHLTFEPVRDLFAAIFFVSMGMLFDAQLALQAWPLALALAAFAILSRGLAAASGMVLSGQPIGEGVQVGLSLLPLGEFSFVIAQLGVSMGIMPPEFYPATVGAALITTLLAPPLMRRGPALGRYFAAHEPRLFYRWRSLLERLRDTVRRRAPERRRAPLLDWLRGVFREALAGSQTTAGTTAAMATISEPIAGERDWGLRVHEHAISDLSPAVGRALGELPLRPRFNTTVSAIDRRGFILTNPGASTALYPGDRLLLVASAEDLDGVTEWLDTVSSEPPRDRPEDLITESLAIPDGAPCSGETLETLALGARFGVQVLAHGRQGVVTRIPAGTQSLEAGDSIFVLGTGAQNGRLRAWLRSGED